MPTTTTQTTSPQAAHAPTRVDEGTYEVVIVGGGAAGIAVAASLLARAPDLRIAIIDPAIVHYYQPGWTMVGGGVFSQEQTVRAMADVLPRQVQWICAAVTGFAPQQHAVCLESNRIVRYRQLVVCPGLHLDWDGIEGLTRTLGRNGVTSNYRYDLAPYTFELASAFRGGDALFTQPPMPIKCAGAPQKAMYLSCDLWRRKGVLDQARVGFYSAAATLFGVPEYVPALMQYVQLYRAGLHFGHTLTAIDGDNKVATFRAVAPDGSVQQVVRPFDMIHVVPPQVAPACVRHSPLADAAGWMDVDQYTLMHRHYGNVFSLGDVANTPNAKTAAAVRQQAPVVAYNVLLGLGLRQGEEARYNGYGSCPLTVARGKVVLAEFAYGGTLVPSFPAWLLDGTRPSRLAWLLKEYMLPALYWHGMLRGREWLARPDIPVSDS